MNFSDRETVITVYRDHASARAAIRQLAGHGFDITKLSIVGKCQLVRERPLGFYTTLDRVRTWGGLGALWGAWWGLFLSLALFWSPWLVAPSHLGLGPVSSLDLGPVSSVLLGAVTGAALGGLVSALIAGVVGIAKGKEGRIKYHRAARAERYLLVIQGSDSDREQAHALLARAPGDAAFAA